MDVQNYIFTLFALCLCLQVSLCHDRRVKKIKVSKNGRLLSLFSVVTFKNTGCKSQSSLSLGQSVFRNGTCFTYSECSARGGSSSGNCASGFGVCCVFLISAAGATVTQNSSYVRNPGFPTAYSSTSSVSYTVTKVSPDVCWLRLDFESFTLLGPTVSTETQGGVCPDTFRVTTNTGQIIPTICGLNSGQHIYVDLGAQGSDSATIAFAFNGVSTTRVWEIKVSQIECTNTNSPPNGCLQYWTTLTGRISTFNFLSTASSGHLANQDYSACIRRQAGFCCTQFQVCPGIPNAFTLDTSSITTGLVDSLCTLDYIGIPSSNSACSNTGNTLSSKYCGSYFGMGTAAGGTASISQSICDCTPPFQVRFHTDALTDQAIATNPNTIYSRGNCLDFMQLPCGLI